MAFEDLLVNSGIDPLTLRTTEKRLRKNVRRNGYARLAEVVPVHEPDPLKRYRHALVENPAEHVPADLIKPDWSEFLWKYWDKLPHCCAVLLDGSRGTTKTTLAYAKAAELGRPLLVVNCYADLTPEVLLGSLQIRGGDTFWKPGLLQIAAETGAVVLFDEFNVMPSATQAAINPVTDGVQKGIFNPYTCERIDWPNPKIIFAVNSGYAGTKTLQEAFKDRVHTLLAQYLAPHQELALLKSRTQIGANEGVAVVETAAAIRGAAANGQFEFDLSPRALIRHCELVKLGCNRNKAWTESVMHRIGWGITTESTWTAVAALSKSVGDYNVITPTVGGCNV